MCVLVHDVGTRKGEGMGSASDSLANGSHKGQKTKSSSLENKNAKRKPMTCTTKHQHWEAGFRQRENSRKLKKVEVVSAKPSVRLG